MTTLQKIKWSVLCAAMPLAAFAQENSVSNDTYFSNALFNTLLILIIVLLIVIVALGQALKNIAGSDVMVSLFKNKGGNTGAGKSTLAVLLLLACSYATAQQAAPAAAPVANDGTIGGLDQFTFYFMLTVIFLELVVTGVLIQTIKKIVLLAAPPAKKQVAEKPKSRLADRLNAAVDISEEAGITLDHEYDGIRELDNNLPPWWKYGFYLTIVVAVVYMVNFHITRTSPLQKEEYAQSVARANAEIAEYMKNSANNVDENTVKQLTDAGELEAGKALFSANCTACHGKLGEGGVGPNLTDDYWLHAGGIKDIFKTIKYGWPDKGMKSWKEDLSPVQIAQLSSFIKTLHGTNPPNGKEKQGELYSDTETGTAAPDSTSKPALQDTIR